MNSFITMHIWTETIRNSGHPKENMNFITIYWGTMRGLGEEIWIDKTTFNYIHV